jgi:hypothetical protein
MLTILNRLEMNKNKILSLQESIDGDFGVRMTVSAPELKFLTSVFQDLLGWNRFFMREGKAKVDGKPCFIFLFTGNVLAVVFSNSY